MGRAKSGERRIVMKTNQTASFVRCRAIVFFFLSPDAVKNSLLKNFGVYCPVEINISGQTWTLDFYQIEICF